MLMRDILRRLAYRAYQDELDTVWNYHQRVLLEQKEKHHKALTHIIGDYTKEIHALRGKIEQLEYRLEKCSPQ